MPGGRVMRRLCAVMNTLESATVPPTVLSKSRNMLTSLTGSILT